MYLVILLYGVLAFVAATNLILMRRPGRGGDARIAALIPARNEESNLRRLVPVLAAQGFQVFVYDDDSDDGTAQTASEGGATVLKGGKLPEGWTGKNHACHSLAKAAAEASDAEHWVFLDADVYPKDGFLEALNELKRHAPVVTGFPEVLPGRGLEPLFLAWVGWILLATNPFGIVSRTRMGHNRFLNGQFVLWRASVYTQLWPHEQMRDAILEDVRIGRLLAKEEIRVETADVSGVLAVRMYENWRQTLDGMSKNSFEITGSAAGTLLLAILMLVFGWAWVLVPWTLALFVFSGLCVVRLCRTPWWPALLMPIAASVGAFTLLRSLWWRRTGRTEWKGRTYSGGVK
ncbi:MAG TPA: glycosyltransferase family 2 protein [Fimbriimonas sp.]